MKAFQGVKEVWIDDDDVEFLRPTIEAFAQKIGRGIDVNTYGDNDDEYIWEPGENVTNFGLGFKLLPTECVGTRVSTAYGFKLNRRQGESCFPVRERTFRGKTIYDEDGYAMAVIDKEALYILFGLYTTDDDNEREAVLILDLIFKDFRLFKQHPRLFGREMKRRTEGKLFKHFAELCAVVRQEIAGKEAEAVAKQIAELKRSLPQLARKVSAISTKNDEMQIKAKILTTYEELKKLDVGGKVSVPRDGKLTINIGQIDIFYDRVVYDIGEFNISIDIERGTLRCYNRTIEIEGFHHPAVDKYGDFEMGEATYGLTVLLGRLEFVLAIKMVINFLQSYDPETCLKDIKLWPVKEATSE